MELKRNRLNLKFIFIAILLGFLFIAGSLCCVPTAHVRADATQYTSVLDDLKKDETFNIAKYPTNCEDYSLQVIQIAESVDGELFVYVYRPNPETSKLLATCISMSVNYSNYNFKLYKLKYINSYGTLEKYVVDDFTIYSDLIRHYEISEIFRTYDKSIDVNIPDSGKIEELSFKVAELWTVKTFADGVEYDRKDVDVVTVTDKYCGALYYAKNVWSPVVPIAVAGFSHFVAFSTDKNIDNLVEVQMSYVATEKEHREWWLWFEKDIDFGSKTHNIVITDKDRASISLEGTFTRDDYIRERISTSSAFLKSEELQNISFLYEELSNKQYVVRFHESVYTKTSGMGSVDERFTQISDVTLLRLRFETDGIMYNLGVVDNKLTGIDPPIKVNPQDKELWEMIRDFFKTIGNWFANNWDWLLIVVLGVILLIVLIPFMPTILSFILMCLKYLFKGLIWLITLPFKGIAALVRKIKERRAGKAA